MSYNLQLKTDNYKGFTLMEVIISLFLFVIVILMVASIYSLSQKTYRGGADEDELWQNARVVLDRMTREIRQAKDIVTVIPPVNDDELNPPPNELEFQDGHDLSEIKYLKYYLDANDNVKRQIIIYCFDSDPTCQNYVVWNSLDEFSNPPGKNILEDKIIGEYFSDIDFWGDDNLFNIEIILNKSGKEIKLMTSVFARNL